MINIKEMLEIHSKEALFTLNEQELMDYMRAKYGVDVKDREVADYYISLISWRLNSKDQLDTRLEKMQGVVSGISVTFLAIFFELLYIIDILNQ